MKSPSDLASKLARQWGNTTLRLQRLLNESDAWPVALTIGKPRPAILRDDPSQVRDHFRAWREVTVGEVEWNEAHYQSTGRTVQYPDQWIISDASQWVAASKNTQADRDYSILKDILAVADPIFSGLLIRRPSLWRGKETDGLKQCLDIANTLSPGCANGLPLRALPIAGNDSKFFERHESLLTSLLDARHDGEASEQGLEAFLGAASERGHWLLLVDLDGSLLPFPQIRVRATDLFAQPLPGSHLLIVENEKCHHQLPKLTGTIAILGAGFDLSWTVAPWLEEKQLAYWGDLDTWGLEMLGRLRAQQPAATSLLMTEAIFSTHQSQSVPEPTPAGPLAHPSLNESEQKLYKLLQSTKTGRLEQEFLPKTLVSEALKNWHRESQSS